jgi:hypothetical protein
MSHSIRSKVRLIAMMVGLLAGASPAHATIPWTDLGGEFFPSVVPAAALRVENGVRKISAYEIDFLNDVWVVEINADTGTWAWNANLGCCLFGNPTAIAWPNHREVFARGGDNQIYHNTSNNNAAWGGWKQLHTPGSMQLCSDPKAISWGANRVDVLVVSCDNHLWNLTWAGSAWNWADYGCCLSGTPGPSTNGPGMMDIFVRDTANNLWVRDYRNNKWTWASMGNVSTMDPVSAGSRDTNGTGAAVGVDTDGSYFSSEYFGPGSGSISADSFAAATNLPALTTEGVGYLAYWVDATGGMFRMGLNEGGASPWTNVSINLWHANDTFVGTPALVTLSPTASSSDVAVFGMKNTGELWFATDSAQ